jgi:hypothetical protein
MTYGSAGFGRLAVSLAALLWAACEDNARKFDVAPPPPQDTAVPPPPVDSSTPGADRLPDRAPDSPATDGGAAEVAPDVAAPDGGVVDGSADGAPSDATGEAGADAAEVGVDRPAAGPLLAHWPLDEGTGTQAADSSGNGNGGTLNGGATWTTSGFTGAQFPNPAALVLDGVDDFVSLGIATLPAPSAPKTISAWFWQEMPSGAGRKNIVALTNLADETGVQLGLDAGRVAVWLTGDMQPLIATSTAATAGWHYVAYTYTGQMHQLQVDTQVIGTASTAPKPGATAVARLGSFDLTDEMFGGRIDDVRIYDRALDAAAIAALASGRTP